MFTCVFQEQSYYNLPRRWNKIEIFDDMTWVVLRWNEDRALFYLNLMVSHNLDILSKACPPHPTPALKNSLTFRRSGLQHVNREICSPKASR